MRATLIACNQTSEEKKRLFGFLEEREVAIDSKVYLFIPTQSCGYCTEESIAFMNSYEKNTRIQFVVGGDSERDLKRLLGQKAKWSHVLLDVKNTAFAEGINSGGVTAFVILENRELESRGFDPMNIKQGLEDIGKMLEE